MRLYLFSCGAFGVAGGIAFERWGVQSFPGWIAMICIVVQIVFADKLPPRAKAHVHDWGPWQGEKMIGWPQMRFCKDPTCGKKEVS